MSSIVCSVRECHNNWKKRLGFCQQEYFEHRPLLRAECSCGAPYNLHPPPKEGQTLRLWMKALKLKKHPDVLLYVPSTVWIENQQKSIPTRDVAWLWGSVEESTWCASQVHQMICYQAPVFTLVFYKVCVKFVAILTVLMAKSKSCIVDTPVLTKDSI